MEKRKRGKIKKFFYRKPDMDDWQGRVDGEAIGHMRWHQHIRPYDLLSAKKIDSHSSLVVLGFACDEGVRRNKGRTGARKGPAALRKALDNLPVFFPKQQLFDAGDIICNDDQLETAQEQLQIAVHQILSAGAFPILLGGGHEITYGHYNGIYEFVKPINTRNIGIINFDAHFDIRIPDAEGVSSGTGFWQIAQDCSQRNERFAYLALGIQKTSNTPALFETANLLNTAYVLYHHFHADSKHILHQYISSFIEQNDRLYITIDLDVFAAAYAPGVSAPAYNGILPDIVFFDCLNLLFDSGKVVSIDIAELNPEYDIDNRTAKLAASILFHIAERLMRKG